MKIKYRSPYVPLEKHATFRQEIISVLTGRTLSAREISAEIGTSEKEVVSHLEHIRMAARKSRERLVIIPAECKKCGFKFKKRERLAKPGKCPLCRCQQIQEPCFCRLLLP
ncbi:MAG: transcriptional regulator [Desulfobacteraceae bacterium]|nr:transcriptional regulator [Desulfobacteraceae bacterium]MBC2720351.1 transcriptional regulator [Desulfobacteraceae bacterium]